eukprot:s396_g12.t1
MAPILSKDKLPPKLRPEDAAKVVVQKARPFLDSLLKVVEVSIQTGGVVVDEAKTAMNNIGYWVDQCMHSSAQLLQALCCIDLDKFTRGPEKPALHSQLPVMFVVGLLVMMYSAFVFAYLPAAGLALNSQESLVFHAFVFLTLASFAQAARTDPGNIPEGPEWRDRNRPPRNTHEQKRFSEEPRWCRKSEAFKPDRAHFCRAMGRVVLRMDHHCPWLGNTVGWANHKYFYLFLAYTSAACSLLGMSVLELLVHATLPALTTFLLIGTEALTFLLTSILVPFFLFHTWLIVRNLTTIEFCASFAKTEDEKPYDNPYDVGIFRNVCAVLGSSPLTWWAPVGGPMGDGINFPRKGLPEYFMLSDEDDPEAAHPTGVSEGSGDDDYSPSAGAGLQEVSCEFQGLAAGSAKQRREQSAMVRRAARRAAAPLLGAVVLLGSARLCFVAPRIAPESLRKGVPMKYKVTLETPTGVKEIECPPDDLCLNSAFGREYILDVAAEAGLDLPYACRAGACSSCAGKVLEGSVDQSDQAFLDEKQVKDGYCLTCVTKPTEDVRIKTHVEKDINRALESATADTSTHREVMEAHAGGAASTGIRFRQNFAEQSEHLLNQQVQMELAASHAYLAMSAYFDRADVALPGFKDIEKFIQYINLRGGRYVSLPVPEPAVQTFASAMDAMETALKMDSPPQPKLQGIGEINVNHALLKMHKTASDADDAQLCDYLESNFLEEQVESVNEIAQTVRKLMRPGIGEYMVDKEMA